jgi:hypothetical protein
VGKRIAHYAKGHPFFRGMCIQGAQLYHAMEVGFGPGDLTMSQVPPLVEEKAIALGCELLSEFLVFALAFGALAYEYERCAFAV